MALGDLGLERENALRRISGFRTTHHAAQFEQPSEVRAILLADLTELIVIAQVELPLRQPKTSVGQHHNVPIRIFLIDRDATDDGRVHRYIRSVHQPTDIRVRLKPTDLIQHRLHGREAASVDRCGIHERTIKIPNLALRRTLYTGIRCEVLNDFARIDTCAIGELIKSAPSGSIGRQHLAIHPPTTRVAEEVIPRSRGRIFASDIKTP